MYLLGSAMSDTDREADENSLFTANALNTFMSDSSLIFLSIGVT